MKKATITLILMVMTLAISAQTDTITYFSNAYYEGISVDGEYAYNTDYPEHGVSAITVKNGEVSIQTWAWTSYDKIVEDSGWQPHSASPDIIFRQFETATATYRVFVAEGEIIAFEYIPNVGNCYSFTYEVDN